MRSREVVVVVRRGEEFLVLERAPARGGYWNLVAGGVEAGEEPEAAAARELREETGLDVLPAPLGIALSYEGPAGRVLLDPYVADAPAAWEPVLDDEHVAYRWCSRDDAVALLAYEEPRVAVRAAAA